MKRKIRAKKGFVQIIDFILYNFGSIITWGLILSERWNHL
jgi:hypothetical protein